MKCANCKKDAIRPLELYKGNWYCPYCKADLFPDTSTQLCVNAQNHELFVNAEENYFKWLTNANYDRASRFKFLDKAINLCMESAFSYHPKALMRMGYYYEKGYVDLNRSLEDRWRIAYYYYKAVVFNINDSMDIQAKQTLLEYDTNKIKLDCAKNLVNLLLNLPSGIQNSVGFDGYANINELLKAVYAKISQLGGSYKEEEIAIVDVENSITDVLYRTVTACLNEDRAPVFAIFKLTREQAVRAFNKYITGMVSRDLKFKIADVKNDTAIQGVFYDIKTPMSLEKKIEECGENGIYVCLMNKKGGHKYFKKRKLSSILDTLAKNNDKGLRRLIDQKIYNKYVFYDDDFYYYSKRGKTIERIVKDFLDGVCEEE